MSAIALLHWHHVHEDAACRLFDVMKSPTPGRSSLTSPNLKLFSFSKEQKLFLGGLGGVKDEPKYCGIRRGGGQQEYVHKGRALLLDEQHVLYSLFLIMRLT